jgi:hypothetical protein
MPDDTTIIDSESILEVLQTAASGPEEVQTDAGRVKQFSLADIIAAHKYLSQVQATEQTDRGTGLRFAQFVPSGTVLRSYRGYRCQ